MKAIFQKVAVNSSPNACGCLNVIRNISPSNPRRYSTSGFDGKDGGVNKHNGVPPMVDVDYNEPQSLPLPVYPKRPDETLEVKKQRLLYQSRKRGMLENDLLLSTFAAKYLRDLDSQLTEQYDRLINDVSNDWDIYYWATCTKPTPAEFDNEIMRMLKEHVSNVHREQRFKQPDL